MLLNMPCMLASGEVEPSVLFFLAILLCGFRSTIILEVAQDFLVNCGEILPEICRRYTSYFNKFDYYFFGYLQGLRTGLIHSEALFAVFWG